VGVDHRGGHVRMAQQLLHGLAVVVQPRDVRSSEREIGRGRNPQGGA
jgi:hypothetical protein